MRLTQVEDTVAEYFDENVKRIIPYLKQLSEKLDIENEARYFSIFFTEESVFPHNTQLCIYSCHEKEVRDAFEDFDITSPSREIILKHIALGIYEEFSIPAATKADIDNKQIYLFTSQPLPEPVLKLDNGNSLRFRTPIVQSANGGVIPTDLGFEGEDMEIKRSMARMMLNNEIAHIKIRNIPLTRLLNRDSYPRIEQVVRVTPQGLQVARFLLANRLGNMVTGRGMAVPEGQTWLLDKYNDANLMTQYKAINIRIRAQRVPLVMPFPVIDWVTHVLESGRIVAIAVLKVRWNTPPTTSLKVITPAIKDKSNTAKLLEECHFYVADYSTGNPRFSRLGFTFDLISDIEDSSNIKREDARRFLRDHGLMTPGNLIIIDKATEFVRVRRNRVSYKHRIAEDSYYVPTEMLVPSVDQTNAPQFEKALGLDPGYLRNLLWAMNMKTTTLYALEYHAIMTLIKEALSQARIRVNMVRLAKQPDEIPLVIKNELRIPCGEAANPIALVVGSRESEISGPLKNKYEASEYELEEGDFIEFRSGPLQPIYALVGATRDGQDGYAVIPTHAIAYAFGGKLKHVHDTKQKSSRGVEYRQTNLFKPLHNAFASKEKTTVGIIGTSELVGTVGVSHAETCSAVWHALNGNHEPLKRIMDRTKIRETALKNWETYISYMATAFGTTSRLEVKYYPIDPMRLSNIFNGDFVIDFRKLLTENKVFSVYDEYAKTIQEAILRDGCDALIVFQPRGRLHGKDALYSYMKTCALDLRKPIKIYDQPRGKGAWTLQKQIFRVIVQMLMELNESLGGRNFEPLAFDYQDTRKPAFVHEQSVEEWRRCLVSGSSIPDFFRYYGGPLKIWAFCVSRGRSWNQPEGGRIIGMVMGKPIGGSEGKLVLSSLETTPGDKLEPWIGEKMLSMINGASTPPQLVIILRDTKSSDFESMGRIADRIKERGIDVLCLGFSTSGVPHGWSFQMKSGRLKVKPPSEYMIGVGSSVYVFSHYKPLVYGVWKATNVIYYPEVSRGAILKYIEQPPPNTDWPPSKCVLHNLANLVHLMARDASYSPTPRENKQPMLLTKADDLNRLIKDKKLPFAVWATRQERETDLRLL